MNTPSKQFHFFQALTISRLQSDKAPQRILPSVSLSDTLYVEADGSMIFSREEGWKEVKAARLFKASDCLHPDGKPGFIQQSHYLATLDSSKDFCATLEKLVEHYGTRSSQLVFITNGAPWLKNWIADAFRESVSILDLLMPPNTCIRFVNCISKIKRKASGGRRCRRNLYCTGRSKQLLPMQRRKVVAVR